MKTYLTSILACSIGISGCVATTGTPLPYSISKTTYQSISNKMIGVANFWTFEAPRFEDPLHGKVKKLAWKDSIGKSHTYSFSPDKKLLSYAQNLIFKEPKNGIASYDETDHYQYDTNNRITTLRTIFNGSLSKQVSYIYDSNGLLIEKKYQYQKDSTSTKIRYSESNGLILARISMPETTETIWEIDSSTGIIKSIKGERAIYTISTNALPSIKEAPFHKQYHCKKNNSDNTEDCFIIESDNKENKIVQAARKGSDGFVTHHFRTAGALELTHYTKHHVDNAGNWIRRDGVVYEGIYVDGKYKKGKKIRDIFEERTIEYY